MQTELYEFQESLVYIWIPGQLDYLVRTCLNNNDDDNDDDDDGCGGDDGGGDNDNKSF